MGCQAVTPTSANPFVKSTMMSTKPWRYLAVDLMGPLPRGESLLVTVDYFSRWIEVDVVKCTTSSVVIGCLEKHFSRHGIPEMLRTDNGPNLVSSEVEKFLNELGINHVKTTPLWPWANGEIERQKMSLLKYMRVAQVEENPWQRELQKYLLVYRSTPHTITGTSPADLLYERKIRTKLHEFEVIDTEEEEGQSSHQEALDRDGKQKQRIADQANKKAVESDHQEGEEVLLRAQR